jgi:hypothetical protein
MHFKRGRVCQSRDAPLIETSRSGSSPAHVPQANVLGRCDQFWLRQTLLTVDSGWMDFKNGRQIRDPVSHPGAIRKTSSKELLRGDLADCQRCVAASISPGSPAKGPWTESGVLVCDSQLNLVTLGVESEGGQKGGIKIHAATPISGYQALLRKV